MTRSSRPTRSTILMLVGTVILAQYGAPTEAREPQPRHANKRAHGDYTHQTQVQRTASGHTRNDTWTNSQGKTASRNAIVVNDKHSGTRTRDVVLQGPQGQQTTRHDVTQRTTDGYARQTTVTQADGDATTRNVTATYDSENHAWTRDVSVDHEDGG
jgi:hypothetical protein